MIQPLNISMFGLTGARDARKTKTGDLLIAENVDFGDGDVIQRAKGLDFLFRHNPGNSNVPTATKPEIHTGIDWLPDEITQRMVIVRGNTTAEILKFPWSGSVLGTPTTIKTGLTLGNPFYMVEGGREAVGNNAKLFIFNGIDTPQVLSGDGAVTTDIASPHGDWAGSNKPGFGTVYQNRLVVAGFANNPHGIYFSHHENHEDFTTSGETANFIVQPGPGKISGITSAFSKLIIWKHPLGVYYLQDDSLDKPFTDSTITDPYIYIKPLTFDVGMALTPHALAQIDAGTVSFVSQSGDIILLQETSGSVTGFGFTNLSRSLNLRNFIQANVNISKLNKTQMLWLEDPKQLWITFVPVGQVIPSNILILDFNGETVRTEWTNYNNLAVPELEDYGNQALWGFRDSNGDNNTKPALAILTDIFRADYNSPLIRISSGISYNFKTVIQNMPTDFSDLDKEALVKKAFYRLHLEFVPTGDYNLPVQILIDGKNYGTVNFNMTSRGTTLPFTLPATLGQDYIRRRSRDIAGDGYYISLRIEASTSGIAPKITNAFVEFEPLTPSV